MIPRLRVVQNPTVQVEADPDETPGDAAAVQWGPVQWANEDGGASDFRHGPPFGPIVDNRTTHPQVRERPHYGAQAWGAATDAESADAAAGSTFEAATGAAWGDGEGSGAAEAGVAPVPS